MNEKFLLRMNKVSKTFPGVKALDHVDFSMSYGEVHGLMGENGAGKSTLIKILTGLYHKDRTSGEIIFDGETINPETPLQAQSLGISTIYQEVNLVSYLSVSENVFLGREPKKYGLIDWQEIQRRTDKILQDMGIHIDVKAPVYTYGTAIQQMVSIARALSINARLIVMDEPTSSLDTDEVTILFKVIKKLQARGISILFISHRIDEIFEITSKVTILKDGILVGEYDTVSLDKTSLVSKMIGRDASSLNTGSDYCRDRNEEILCRMTDINQGTRLHNMSLEIGKGEIVGLAGLLGAGRTELARVLFGDTSPDSGTIEVNGIPVRFDTPGDAIDRHFAYCSEDRKAEGIIPQMSLKQNLSLASLKHISRYSVISNDRENQLVESFMAKLKIKAFGPSQRIDTLSGGNQQKVLLGRWLSMKPALVILDEPTRGIDVGAKAEIENLIQEMAGEGISILMISSELEELVRGCDRVVVIRDGRNLGELCGSEISEGNIMKTIAKEHKVFS